MQEWEVIFLDVPRLYESVEVFFDGKRYPTSHITTIETVAGTDPPHYRVRTISGGQYVGPVGTEDDVTVAEPEAEPEP